MDSFRRDALLLQIVGGLEFHFSESNVHRLIIVKAGLNQGHLQRFVTQV